MKKIIAALLSMCIITGGLPAVNRCTDTVCITASASSASGINVRSRSQSEIRSYISSHPFARYTEDTFATKPSITSPYNAGKLSTVSAQNALDSLNVMRYIAGLSEVKLKDDYSELAQYSSLVNCVNGSLSHFPTKPSNMSSSMYDLGYKGSGSSNIASAGGSMIRSCAWSVSEAWMKDEDSSNISALGHRRWCLNPTMGYTGFGLVSKTSQTYGHEYSSAMYAFDRSNSSAGEYGVCWPAQNMPTEFFNSNDVWSISMNQNVDASKVKVTLTRQNDGKKWTFSKSSSNGDFYVNNEAYGQTGCIIFRPTGVSKYSNGDVYKVDITGLSTGVSYTVSFFDSGFKDSLPGTSTTTTTTTTAAIVRPKISGTTYGDFNGDRIINAVDASNILVLYAALSSGGALSNTELSVCDINRDNLLNAVDASLVLAYYADLALNPNMTLEQFVNKKK